MENYCRCKNPDLDTADNGVQFCVNCLKQIKVPDYEPEYEPEYIEEDIDKENKSVPTLNDSLERR